jgi:hypothetical protein
LESIVKIQAELRTFGALPVGTKFVIVRTISAPKSNCPVHEKIEWQEDPDYPFDPGHNCIVHEPGGKKKFTYIYNPIKVSIVT